MHHRVREYLPPPLESTEVIIPVLTTPERTAAICANCQYFQDYKSNHFKEEGKKKTENVSSDLKNFSKAREIKCS